MALPLGPSEFYLSRVFSYNVWFLFLSKPTLEKKMFSKNNKKLKSTDQMVLSRLNLIGMKTHLHSLVSHWVLGTTGALWGKVNFRVVKDEARRGKQANGNETKRTQMSPFVCAQKKKRVFSLFSVWLDSI